MNSRKSLCRRTDGLLVPRDQLDQQLEPLYRRQRREIAVVGRLGFVERAEPAERSLHVEIIPGVKATAPAARRRRRGAAGGRRPGSGRRTRGGGAIRRGR